MTHIPDEAVQAAADKYSDGGGHGLDMPDILEVARDMIEAAIPYLSAPCAVEVKKLEWVAGDGISAAKSYYEAKANGLTYCVIDGQCWIESLGISIQKIGTDKEAKAAAQSDFERRVRECIVAKPVDVAEVRRQAFEEAARIADNGMLVPPDGGSPTEDEIAIAENIAAAIRAISAEPAQ